MIIKYNNYNMSLAKRKTGLETERTYLGRLMGVLLANLEAEHELKQGRQNHSG
jgi:hypothetical protein